MNDIETREVRFPSQRDRWTELGGVWLVECNRCGSYDHNSNGLGTGTFLRGYPTEADAQTAGDAHELCVYQALDREDT